MLYKGIFGSKVNLLPTLSTETLLKTSSSFSKSSLYSSNLCQAISQTKLARRKILLYNHSVGKCSSRIWQMTRDPRKSGPSSQGLNLQHCWVILAHDVANDSHCAARWVLHHDLKNKNTRLCWRHKSTRNGLMYVFFRLEKSGSSQAVLIKTKTMCSVSYTKNEDSNCSSCNLKAKVIFIWHIHRCGLEFLIVFVAKNQKL